MKSKGIVWRVVDHPLFARVFNLRLSAAAMATAATWHYAHGRYLAAAGFAVVAVAHVVQP